MIFNTVPKKGTVFFYHFLMKKMFLIEEKSCIIIS